MKIPLRYQTLNLKNVRFDESGYITDWKKTYSFLPHGFLDASLFEVGNGDSTGFYWSIGREEQEPILCDIYHDGLQLVPIASNLEGLIQIKWSEGYGNLDDFEPAEKLGINLEDNNTISEFSPAQLLKFDMNSPYYLVQVASEAINNNEFEIAENHLKTAIKLLSEYGQAHYYLAKIYRRIPSRKLEAAQAMIAALCSPFVFIYMKNRMQVLKWLQRAESHMELVSDPIWLHRKTLNLAMGFTQNRSIDIYEEAIEEYLNQGKIVHAISLREFMGTLMIINTQAFRKYHKYSREKHNKLLAENLKQAGLENRIVSIRWE